MATWWVDGRLRIYALNGKVFLQVIFLLLLLWHDNRCATGMMTGADDTRYVKDHGCLL